jgi:hypothetical protein
VSWQETARTTVVFGIMALLSLGCQFENVGGIERSPEVTAAFETLRISAEYQYYFLNQENNPFGVVGLKSGYWIEGPEWRSVDPSAPVFTKVVESVKRFPAQGGFTEGYYVYDSRKSPIGVWYSSLGAGITVDPSTKRVMITTARPWLQQ